MLITLDCAPWLFMLGPIVIAFVLVNTLKPEEIEFENKILGFVIFNAALLVAMVVFGVWVRMKRHHLAMHMGIRIYIRPCTGHRAIGDHKFGM